MYYGEPQDNVPAFSLTIISGGESGQRFVFSQPEVTLGRIADNDLVLYDAAVSRRHLVFYFRNNQFILEDLGSSNGSQLNGVAITQPTVLCEHDVLDVGSVRFQFSTDNVSEYDDTDDPTEIELGAVQPSSEALPAAQPAGPIVRARWEASNGGPLPPEGDTRQFAAHQIRGASGPVPPPQRGGPLGPASGPMPNPGVTMDPQAMMPNPHRPSPTGLGIKPPSHPPPQQPRQPQPEQRFNPSAAPSQPALSAAPSSPQYPAAMPATAPPIAPPGQAQPPAMLQMPNQLAGLSPRGPMGRQDQQLQLMERRRIRAASIWSTIALAAVVALFFIPFPKPKAGRVMKNKKEAILYNNNTHKQYYGYNNKDQHHPKSVTLQVFYRGGRARISYNVISPEPVRIELNGEELTTVDPTGNKWHYDRHKLPKQKLKKGYNRIAFIRAVQRGKLTIWGVTQFKFEETIFPAADYNKAKAQCKLGQEQYQKRDKRPDYRHKAIKSFQRCRDYLATLKDPPSLYKEAALMISQINRQLDLMLHQKLQQARSLKSQAERQKIYRSLIRFFPDSTDPRHNKLSKLEGNTQ